MDAVAAMLLMACASSSGECREVPVRDAFSSHAECQRELAEVLSQPREGELLLIGRCERIAGVDATYTGGIGSAPGPERQPARQNALVTVTAHEAGRPKIRLFVVPATGVDADTRRR